MLETEREPVVTPELRRVFQKLNYQEGGTLDEGEIRSRLTPETRQYLDRFTAAQSSGNDDIPRLGDVEEKEASILLMYLCWCLEHGRLEKAVATIRLLEHAFSDVEPDASTFDDIMQFMTLAGAKEVVPPSLLVRWGRVLQVKGDLHGAMRQLNAAKDQLSENKNGKYLNGSDIILGKCTQLAGLTLNKMCCWKSAIGPLMESIDLFRRCHDEQDGKTSDGAAALSMEMVARCLCSITHGDYLDIKDKLHFPQENRFYQAYSMCVEAAGFASSSTELLLIRTQNQAAEAMLKYAAHAFEELLEEIGNELKHEAEERLLGDLELVIKEATKSLHGHTNAEALRRREQFFELVRSLFLISQALAFSTTSQQDKCLAKMLGERARILYEEYCRQLSAKDFRPDVKVDMSEIPAGVRDIIDRTVDEFGLHRLRHKMTTRIEARRGDVLQSGSQNRRDKKSFDRMSANHQEQTPVSSREVQYITQPGQLPQKHITIISFGKAQGSHEKGQNSKVSLAASNSSSLPVGSQVMTPKISMTNGSDVTPLQPPHQQKPSAASHRRYHGQEEVGLPIDPDDNAIPVYDVPLTIFQALCGCKFNQKERSSSLPSHSAHDRDEPEESAERQGTKGPRHQPEAELAENEKRLGHKNWLSDFTDHEQSNNSNQRANGDESVRVRTTETSSSSGSGRSLGSEFHFDQRGSFKEEQFSPLPVESASQDSGYSSVALVDTFLTTKLPHASSQALPFDCSRSGHIPEDSDRSLGMAEESSHASRSKWVQNGIVGHPSAGLTSFPCDSVKRARLLKFNPVTGLWTSQTTLVYLGRPLDLDEKVKGNCREAFHVQFLHQDEVLGRYVGKRYRRQKPPSQYLQDVTCQKTARFLVTLFNYALSDLRYDIQIVYVPVAHVQLLSGDGNTVEDWLNVEPYLQGDFIKLTNNLKYCNNQGRTLATALTHFTYSVSEGKLMLVDLQGWLPREGRGVVYLTDPQFHTVTSGTSPLSSCDLGQQGMAAFWESVHPQCNTVCQALGLKRPTLDS